MSFKIFPKGHLSTLEFFLLPLLFLSFIGCDSNKQRPVLSLGEQNQNCLEGKVSGQFLVLYSNGKTEVVSASSRPDFLNKISSNAFQEKLHKNNIFIQDVDYNFKAQLTKKETNTEPGLLSPLSTQNNNDINIGPLLLNADYLWDRGFEGQGALTALIDSGYDITHPLLADSVAPNLMEQGQDEDQNGFLNDKSGWDFINDRPLDGDLEQHGTIVGSIIAAKHVERFRFSMAPQSKIIPIAALQPAKNGDTDASGDSNSVIKAIDYALLRNADFINASWAGENCSKFIRAKIKDATDSGVVFITAAGNENLNLDNTPIFPGSFPFSFLVNVGALNHQLDKQKDSNYGSFVDFFTLGESVLVAAPHQSLGLSTGTSIAAPFITGALALLKSAFPTARHDALLNALEKSKNSKKIPDLQRAFSILKNP